MLTRARDGWCRGFVNYLDLKSLTTAGKSETAKFFAGAGQCSATNKGTEVGEVSISAVPGAGNDVEVTVTFTYVQQLPSLFFLTPRRAIERLGRASLHLDVRSWSVFPNVCTLEPY
jgi:hypothetical protein